MPRKLLILLSRHTANADQIKHCMDGGLTDIGLLLEPVETERYEYIRMPVRERWAAVMPSDVPLAKREYVTAAFFPGSDVFLEMNRSSGLPHYGKCKNYHVYLIGYEYD